MGVSLETPLPPMGFCWGSLLQLPPSPGGVCAAGGAERRSPGPRCCGWGQVGPTRGRRGAGGRGESRRVLRWLGASVVWVRYPRKQPRVAGGHPQKPLLRPPRGTRLPEREYRFLAPTGRELVGPEFAAHLRAAGPGAGSAL